jgi:hypothetical protein
VETEGSLPCSQDQATGPCPRPPTSFFTIYFNVILPPKPTPIQYFQIRTTLMTEIAVKHLILYFPPFHTVSTTSSGDLGGWRVVGLNNLPRPLEELKTMAEWKDGLQQSITYFGIMRTTVT